MKNVRLWNELKKYVDILFLYGMMKPLGTI